MQVQEIPVRYVKTMLRAVRLPITAAEATLRRGQSSAEWPPALAFEAFEANVKQVMGSVLRDDTLLQEGRLTQAKLAELRRAANLETVAEQQRAETEAEYNERIRQDEARAAEVARQADARERAVEQRASVAKADAARTAAEKERTGQKLDSAHEKAIDQQEREGRKTAIAKERQALAQEQRALREEDKVNQIDKELSNSKAARKAR